ncbi:DUF6103 family protein [Sinanaerobacter chloroacetimidivorans]|uniref:Uncharacterized protein n=1 Tax=Sinanaerobacter chloroacetimidivorans TaxID=2818044 RepID=A0A8J7W3J5_9FIRM|nr:DUF6103 family protein [Sinanaerobacter chloroacetimidivorans]MBR0598441.1 hypothetical protein [Sinanaerobacter chloroacetimidivorans]
MKQDTVTVSFDAAKLKAIKLYMSRKGVSLEQELAEQLNKLYEKYVPVNVRDYIGETEDVGAGNAQPRQVK